MIKNLFLVLIFFSAQSVFADTFNVPHVYTGQWHCIGSSTFYAIGWNNTSHGPFTLQTNGEDLAVVYTQSGAVYCFNGNAGFLYTATCPSNSTGNSSPPTTCTCNSGYKLDATGAQCVVINPCQNASPISGTYSSSAALSSTLCISGCLVTSGFDAVSSGGQSYYFLHNVQPSTTQCTGSLTSYTTSTTAADCLAHGQYASTVNGVTVCTDTAPTVTNNVSIVPPPPTLNCQTEPYYCAAHNLTDGNGYTATCNASGVCSAVAPTNAIAGTGAVSSVASTTTTCSTDANGVQTCTGTTTTTGSNSLDISTLNKESTQQQIASSLNTIAANSDFCAKNPNAEACATLGTAPAGDPLQTKTIDVSQTNWSAFSFTGNATCPADYVLQLHGGAPPLTFSYAAVCSFMNIFRPIAIAIAFYIAGLILLGKKES